jgi:decaprenylphospho-beta-D-ribofuranose 2-oxidase
VLDAGGRIYLGKDAFLDAKTFAAMYPRLDEFRAIKARVDPAGVFTSDLSRRLGIGG